jgi:hypothetical protein
MNTQVMKHLNFTMGQWMGLGLRNHDVETMDVDVVKRCFDMNKDEVVVRVVYDGKIQESPSFGTGQSRQTSLLLFFQNSCFHGP